MENAAVYPLPQPTRSPVPGLADAPADPRWTVNAGAAGEAPARLAALSGIRFAGLGPAQILGAATAAVAALGPCDSEGTFRRRVGEGWARWPSSQAPRPGIDKLLRGFGGAGPLDFSNRRWCWGFAVRNDHDVADCLIVSADSVPADDDIAMLTILTQHAGYALGCAEMHERETGRLLQLREANAQLATALQRLRDQTTVYEVLGEALAAGSGEQGIVEALHRLTGLAVALEDRFGNLRSWAGPDAPHPYPKPDPYLRRRQLRLLATGRRPLRIGDRMAVLVQPRAEILGVLALVDPKQRVTPNQLYALQYAGTVMGLDLSHSNP